MSTKRRYKWVKAEGVAGELPYAVVDKHWNKYCPKPKPTQATSYRVVCWCARWDEARYLVDLLNNTTTPEPQLDRNAQLVLWDQDKDWWDDEWDHEAEWHYELERELEKDEPYE